MPTSSEKSQDQKAACHKETPYKFVAVICSSKGQAEFYVISQQFIKPGWVQTLNRNSALQGAWIPAFDCHKAWAGFPLAPTQEVCHSCWSLVTPYLGGGSISMVKQQIPRLWLTASKFFWELCHVFQKS